MGAYLILRVYLIQIFLSRTANQLPVTLSLRMSKQRVAVWETEAEVDEDLQDVDLNLAIGNYGQNGAYEDGVYARQCHRVSRTNQHNSSV